MRFPLFALVLASVSALGYSDDTPSPPKAFVYAQIGPGVDKDVNDSTRCKLTTEEWLSLGKPEAGVESGTMQSESQVTTSCSVVPEADGFRVAASASLERRGSFTVSGFFKASGEQPKIRGSFTRGDTGTFRQDDCTVTYEGQQGVAAGRVWGKISCPKASFQGGQDRTCLGTAEFKFETCDQ